MSYFVTEAKGHTVKVFVLYRQNVPLSARDYDPEAGKTEIVKVTTDPVEAQKWVEAQQIYSGWSHRVQESDMEYVTITAPVVN